MSEIALRELRSHTSAVLRRVEAGERLIVTANRRPVAALIPLDRRRTWIPVHEMWRRIAATQADSALSGELDEILSDRISDL